VNDDNIALLRDALSTLRAENAQAHEAILQQLAIQNGRLRSLEIWRARAMGWCAGVLAACGLIVTLARIL